MKYFMQCGCSFDINEQIYNKIGKDINFYKDRNIIPPIVINWKKLPDCSRVWEILGEGYTKGVFQLESGLGRSYAKKLKPTCLEHLSALGSILRPGCLESLDENGISTTDHYCLRKNLAEEVQYPHECLKGVLEKTYGIAIYQEQAIAIAKIVAGFSLSQADSLRKSIGKKIPEEMAKCKTMFLEGAKKTGLVSDEIASKLFEGIEASQRYSFNKSHSFAYAINGFRSAYAKTHIPVHFFCSYLTHAQNKQKPLLEIAELVNEAKIFGIKIYTPSLSSLKEHFHIIGPKDIRYGLVDVKGIGESQFEKIQALNQRANIIYNKNLHELTWDQFLPMSADLSKTVVENLILSGATDCYDIA